MLVVRPYRRVTASRHGTPSTLFTARGLGFGLAGAAGRPRNDAQLVRIDRRRCVSLSRVPPATSRPTGSGGSRRRRAATHIGRAAMGSLTSTTSKPPPTTSTRPASPSCSSAPRSTDTRRPAWPTDADTSGRGPPSHRLRRRDRGARTPASSSRSPPIYRNESASSTRHASCTRAYRRCSTAGRGNFTTCSRNEPVLAR